MSPRSGAVAHSPLETPHWGLSRALRIPPHTLVLRQVCSWGYLRWFWGLPAAKDGAVGLVSLRWLGSRTFVGVCSFCYLSSFQGGQRLPLTPTLRRSAFKGSAGHGSPRPSAGALSRGQRATAHPRPSAGALSRGQRATAHPGPPQERLSRDQRATAHPGPPQERLSRDQRATAHPGPPQERLSRGSLSCSDAFSQKASPSWLTNYSSPFPRARGKGAGGMGEPLCRGWGHPLLAGAKSACQNPLANPGLHGIIISDGPGRGLGVKEM